MDILGVTLLPNPKSSEIVESRVGEYSREVESECRVREGDGECGAVVIAGACVLDLIIIDLGLRFKFVLTI